MFTLMTSQVFIFSSRITDGAVDCGDFFGLFGKTFV